MDLRFSALIGAVLLLGAGSAAALEARPTALAAMTEQYGAYDAEMRAWRHRVASEDATFLMRIREARKVAVPGGERLYIVAAGDSAAADTAPRAANGLAGLFIYEEIDGKTKLLAGIKDLRVGSGGRAVFQARLAQLGPDHYYGWIVGTGSTGQGWTVEQQWVLAPHGRAVDTLVALRKSIDSAGMFPCADPGFKDKCMSLTYALTIDTTKLAAHVFPLILEKTGVQDGRLVVPETFNIPFDEKTWRYLPPRAVQPE